MIDNFATKISTALVRKFPDELPPLGVTRYGIKFIISNVLPILLLIIIGYLMGINREIAISYISFAILRMVSGGYHAKKPETCLIISTILLVCIAKFGYLLFEYQLIMSLISLIMVLVYAPSDIKNQTKILEEHFKYLKLISVVIVLIGALMNNYLVIASMLVQSLLLIPMRGGEKIDQNKND